MEIPNDINIKNLNNNIDINDKLFCKSNIQHTIEGSLSDNEGTTFLSPPKKSNIGKHSVGKGSLDCGASGVIESDLKDQGEPKLLMEETFKE